MRLRITGWKLARSFFSGLFVLVLLISTVRAQASAPLTGELVTSGLSRPVFVTHTSADPNRIYIVEQRVTTSGRVRIYDLATHTLLPVPFLAVSAVGVGEEQGLLCMAFDPEHAVNGHVYVSFVDSINRLVIRRYTRVAGTDFVSPASAHTILIVNQPQTINNGGWLGFGPEGFLYLSTGDGGGDCDSLANAQNLDSFLGKMLRIDINGDDFPLDPTRNYSIPTTNPFFGDITVEVQETWSYGLRNPWRCAFDRDTGDFYIADVGQKSREEIDFQSAGGAGGENYGWSCREGDVCSTASGCPPPGPQNCDCNDPTLVDPVHVYDHTADNCAIIGGEVYRGCLLSELHGAYLFADHCSSRIWSLTMVGGVVTDLTDRTAEIAPIGGLDIRTISSFGSDYRGDLYICDRADGEVFRIGPSTCCLDCNDNGIPDVCELADGSVPDCNNNGVPDDCDIDSGVSEDHDGNTIPDECEILPFTPPQVFQTLDNVIYVAVGPIQTSFGGKRESGDFDIEDVVAVIPGSDPSQPGHVQVLLNNGVNSSGEWLGFTVLPPIQVGRDPRAAALGYFNFDDCIDLAVANAGDDTVSIFLNNCSNDGTFTFLFNIHEGLSEPTCIAIGDFDFNELDDLAVTNAGNDSLAIFFTTYAARGGSAFPLGQTVGTGPDPSTVVPEDLDDDKDIDLVVSSRTGGTTRTVRNNGLPARGRAGGPALFTALPEIPVGSGPVELAICDLNWDGFPEIINAVNDDHLLSINVSNGDLTFEQTIQIGGIGLTPLSVDCDDFDNDGDNDLVVVAEVNATRRQGRGTGVRLVQLLLNNTPYESTTLVFAPPINLPVDANANFVAKANLNRNFAIDLVTGNSQTASVTALLNRNGCPMDIFGGDGNVTIADVVLVLSSFGPCPPPSPLGCPADITPPPAGDGQVSIADVIAILSAFGQSCWDD